MADADSASSPPEVGQQINFYCTSKECKDYYGLSAIAVVSHCVSRHYVGAGNFKCSRCNRLYVVCTLCSNNNGPFCFLVPKGKENTSYSEFASTHFNSPEHLARFSSAMMSSHDLPREAHAARHNDNNDDDDDDMPLAPAIDDESNAASSAEDLRRQLCMIGLDPHQSQFSSTLFPNMPAAGQYFKDEHFAPGSGRANLVRSALRRDMFDHRVDPMETDVNLELHNICVEIGIDKAARLVETINKIRNRDKLHQFYDIKIPIHREEIRAFYLDNSSSISKTLPLPPITEVEKELTYCPIESIIRHALASDFNNKIDMAWDLEKSNSYSHPVDSPRAAAIVRRCDLMRAGRPTCCIMVHYWEDDADTNNTKKDRGSVHIATVTLASKNTSVKSSQLTYVVSIGAKDANHELVRSLFVSDLNKLSGAEAIYMYHGGLQKIVPVYVSVHCCVVDRVARGALSGQSQGNGKYSAVWGVAMDLQSVHASVPLCSDCLPSVIAGAAVDSTCAACDGWHYRLDSPLLRFPAPPNYPPSELPEDKLLQPVRVTAEVIRERIKIASENLQSMDPQTRWTQREADAYLRAIGLSQSVRDSIIDAISDGRPPPLPSFLGLEGCDVDCHIDTVMHLLFLGIWKYCMKLFASLCKLRGLTIRYHNEVAPAMKEIASMKLEWLKILPWNHGKFGGLVGENFLGLARIAPWLVLPLEKMLEDVPEDLADPEGPPDLWLLSDCKRWLSKRKLNTKKENEEWMKSLEDPPDPLKMNRDLYRLRCRAEMNRDGGPRQPVDLVRTESKRLVAFRFLNLLSGRLMAEEVDPEVKREASNHACLFLQAFHLWDKQQRMETEGQDANLDDDDDESTHPDSGVPSWVKASNFASLKNLVERVMERYGSLRKLWEGGSLGEGVVKDVREFAQNGMRNGWAVSTHTRSMRRMQGRNLPSRDCADGDTSTQTRTRKMYHLYNEGSAAILNRIAISFPISGIVLGTEGIRVKFGIMRSHTEVVIVSATAKACSKYGLDFFSLSVTGEEAINSSELKEYCMFLPLVEDGVRCYSVITSEWRELSEVDTGNGAQALERGLGASMAMF